MYCKIENGRPVYPPKNDGCHFNVDVDPDWLAAHGYTDMTPEQIAAAVTPIVTAKKYSKYKLKLELQKLNLWDTFKGALTEDEYETFLLVQELASDDENFTSTLEKFKSIQNYEAILSACEI